MINKTSNVSQCFSFQSYHSEKEKVIQASVLSVVLVLSLLGNLLVICVIGRNKTLRKGNNSFFLNMAVSDLIVPLMVLPHYIVVYYTRDHTWPLDGVIGDLTCKGFKFLENISPCVSILTLIFMTIDRFCSVFFATRRNVITDKVRNTMIASTWLISSVTSSPYLYAWRVESSKAGAAFECVFKWSDSHSKLDTNKANNIYMTFSLLFYFIFPMSLLTVLYCIMLVRLNTHKGVLSARVAGKTIRMTRRVTFLVVGVFGLFWGPYFILMSLVAFYWNWSHPHICSWPTIILTARFLTFSHGAVNPFIYFIFSRRCRKKLTEMLTSIASSLQSLWRFLFEKNSNQEIELSDF